MTPDQFFNSLSDETRAGIDQLLRQNNLLLAVKNLRDCSRTSTGIMALRDAVEYLRDTRAPTIGVTFHSPGAGSRAQAKQTGGMEGWLVEFAFLSAEALNTAPAKASKAHKAVLVRACESAVRALEGETPSKILTDQRVTAVELCRKALRSAR